MSDVSIDPKRPAGSAPEPEHDIDPPPIMKTWPRLYGLVLAILMADILLFWIVTRVYS